MSDQSCENCSIRKKYEDNPQSIVGRFWRWHANWCPGWKSYMQSLTDEQRFRLAEKYHMEKYLSNK